MAKAAQLNLAEGLKQGREAADQGRRPQGRADLRAAKWPDPTDHS